MERSDCRQARARDTSDVSQSHVGDVDSVQFNPDGRQIDRSTGTAGRRAVGASCRYELSVRAVVRLEIHCFLNYPLFYTFRMVLSNHLHRQFPI